MSGVRGLLVIIEDSPETAELLAAVVEEEGFKPVVCQTAERGAGIRVTRRRVRRGPRLSDWSWLFEVMTSFLQRQERIAFAMPAMADKRLYTDALVFPSPALGKVQRELGQVIETALSASPAVASGRDE